MGAVIFCIYVVALIKWFSTDHYAFWHGFKELIWALIPVINITYVWREILAGFIFMFNLIVVVGKLIIGAI